MEFHCAHLDATGVVANFTGDWRSWGKIDLDSVRVTNEQIYDLFVRGGIAFKPFVAPVQYFNAVTGQMQQYDGNSVLYNGDTGMPLTIAGKQLAASMDVGGHFETLTALVGEVSNMGNIPCRAISFDNGARALIQCLMPQKHYILGREHKGFLSIKNALDGSEIGRASCRERVYVLV